MAFHWGLPQIIDTPGQYLTRQGETVTIAGIAVRGTYRAFGQYGNGISESWETTGRVLPFSESLNDIVSKA